MSKVLVTGASGFIGRRLVKRLISSDNGVACLVRKTSKVQPLTSLGAEMRFGDVTDPDSLAAALEGIDQVYHLAGAVIARRPEDFTRVNVEGTENLARACAGRQNPPTLVFVSSLAAAGPAPGGRPRVETDTPAPVSNYGKSKFQAEQRLAAYAERLPISIARPPIVYGPGDMLMLHLFKSVARGFHLCPSRQPSLLSLVHSDDLVESLLSIADRGRRLRNSDNGYHEGTYFITADDKISYPDFGRAAARALERKVFVWQFREPVAWMISSFCELGAKITGRPAIFNFDKMRDATAGSWTCSAERAAREVGFTARFPLETGLQQTVRWYQENGYLPRSEKQPRNKRRVAY